MTVYIRCLGEFEICFAICGAVSGLDSFTLFTCQRVEETWSNEYTNTEGDVFQSTEENEKRIICRCL